MSFVESDNDTPSLNLRVFKRSSKYLILLWNRIPDLVSKPLRIYAKSVDSGTKTDVKKFVLDPQSRDDVGESLQVDANMIVCVINEAENGLDEKQNYYFSVEYDGTDYRQSIKVIRAGVLPDHEREERTKNNHNFLWDSKSQMWRKQHGIVIDGKCYAGTVTIPCPSCGYKGESA